MRRRKAAFSGVRRRVFVVDPHALMRTVAAEWINRSSGLEVCGVVGGMDGAFHAIARLRPDLIVSEIMRPQDLGFIRELHRRHPHLPILVFTIQDAAVYAARTREAGASGYVMKDAGGDQLVWSIRAALRARKGRSARRRPRIEPRSAVDRLCPDFGVAM